MQVISFSEARNKLNGVLDSVVDDADHMVITRRDAEDAVRMALEIYNSLIETVHMLNSPANAAHLSRSIEQYRNSETFEQELADD